MLVINNTNELYYFTNPNCNIFPARNYHDRVNAENPATTRDFRSGLRLTTVSIIVPAIAEWELLECTRMLEGLSTRKVRYVVRAGENPGLVAEDVVTRDTEMGLADAVESVRVIREVLGGLGGLFD